MRLFVDWYKQLEVVKVGHPKLCGGKTKLSNFLGNIFDGYIRCVFVTQPCVTCMKRYALLIRDRVWRLYCTVLPWRFL